MVHRRTLFDDALGVSEPLNETAFGQGLVVRGKHFLIVDTPQSSARYHRFGSQHLYMRPLATYALPHLSYADYSAAYRQTWSALTSDLPLNIHLLTFDQIDTKQYLIRVEHYFEMNEDETYSGAVIFDLQKLFQTQGTITDIVELTLAGNLALAEMQRLEWITKDGASSKMKAPSKFLSIHLLTNFFIVFFLQKNNIRQRCEYCFESNANSNIPCNSGINYIIFDKQKNYTDFYFIALILLRPFFSYLFLVRNIFITNRRKNSNK